MENTPAWVGTLIAIGGLIGTLVTAVATIFLWKVTKILAYETTRMVEATSQPHVVATLDANVWSVRHFDLNVNNTGTGTAYDILVKFNPPLNTGEYPKTSGNPLERISVLKPGQGISSYAADYDRLKDGTYQVTVSWRRNPQIEVREENSYTLSLRDLENMSTLGGDPVVKIAEHLKKIQEDARQFGTSRSRIQVDAYLTNDRLHETRVSERRMRALRQRREQTNAAPQAIESPQESTTQQQSD